MIVKKLLKQTYFKLNIINSYDFGKRRSLKALIKKEQPKLIKPFKEALIENQEQLQQLHLQFKNESRQDIIKIKKDWLLRKKSQAFRVQKPEHHK
jgi:predicted lipase